MTVPKRDRVLVPVTILSGQSLSAEVNVGSMEIVGVQMPAGWDAAGLALQAATRSTVGPPNVATFGNVIDIAGVALPLATAPLLDTYVALAPTAAFVGLGRVKVRSGTNAVPVNQTANRDFFLVCLT